MRGRIELAPGVGYALTTNAMIRYQDAAKETFFEGLKGFENPEAFDVRKLRLIIWAGLEDREKTVEDVGDLMDEIGFRAVIEKLKEAVQAAFPDAEVAGGPGNAAAPEK